MAQPKPSLREIAKVAEVSAQAVSLALRDKGRLGEDTRKRILEVADELGYQQNQPSDQEMTIGVIMPLKDRFATELFDGIYATLLNADCIPTLTYPVGRMSDLDLLHKLTDRNVDGIIMRPTVSRISAPQINEIVDSEIPVIILNTEIRNRTGMLDFVGTDDEEGGRLAAEHLLKLGHRRFLILCSGNNFRPMQLRGEGFEAEIMKCKGATCETIDLPQGRPAGPELVNALMADNRPTAVFGTTDWHATRAYVAAEEAKLRIPEDLSVVGFGDLPSSSLATPPITTFQQYPKKIGQVAAKLLIRRITQNHKTKTTTELVVTPDLVIRESTAKAN